MASKELTFDLTPFSLHPSVGEIDLMKKGLRQLVLCMSTITSCYLERLTWWRRDCDCANLRL